MNTLSKKVLLEVGRRGGDDRNRGGDFTHTSKIIKTRYTNDVRKF